MIHEYQINNRSHPGPPGGNTQSPGVGVGKAGGGVISPPSGRALGASSPAGHGLACARGVLRPCLPCPHVNVCPLGRGFTVRGEPPEPFSRLRPRPEPRRAQEPGLPHHALRPSSRPSMPPGPGAPGGGQGVPRPYWPCARARGLRG